MTELKHILPDEVIMSKILIIRNQKVMIDTDMAELYGVTTKRLNESVKRNSKRFPVDFMFHLTQKEKDYLVANCDHLSRLKFPVPRRVFGNETLRKYRTKQQGL
jgi:hypothetical protein